MNFLGIDYGTKRIGLSIGDDTLGLAVPIEAIRVRALDDSVRQIREIVRVRCIQKIIVGYPFNMDGSIGFQAKEVDNFIFQVGKSIAVPIERLDERLTSENVGDLRKRSPKNRQNLRKRGTIDSAAAVLILQDYLDDLNCGENGARKEITID
jgi:putative Holliday junction resolvase